MRSLTGLIIVAFVIHGQGKVKERVSKPDLTLTTDSPELLATMAPETTTTTRTFDLYEKFWNWPFAPKAAPQWEKNTWNSGCIGMCAGTLAFNFVAPIVTPIGEDGHPANSIALTMGTFAATMEGSRFLMNQRWPPEEAETKTTTTTKKPLVRRRRSSTTEQPAGRRLQEATPVALDVQTPSNPISSLSAALVGIFVGCGVTFAVLHSPKILLKGIRLGNLYLDVDRA